jgi:hypothetical protein
MSSNGPTLISTAKLRKTNSSQRTNVSAMISCYPVRDGVRAVLPERVSPVVNDRAEIGLPQDLRTTTDDSSGLLPEGTFRLRGERMTDSATKRFSAQSGILVEVQSRFRNDR